MKNMDISFKPGYCEWVLWIGDEEVGVLQGGELAEDIYGVYNEKPQYNVNEVVGFCLDCGWDDDFDGFFNSEYWCNRVTGNQELYTKVRKVMIDALTRASPPEDMAA